MAASSDTSSRPRPPVWRRGVLVILALGVLLHAAALVWALATGNGEFVFYVLAMAVVAVGLLTAHAVCNFTTPLLALMLTWAVLHMAGGLVPIPASWPINGDVRVLYSWWIVPGSPHDPDNAMSGWLKYDQLVHFLGFFATAWACWQALAASIACDLGVTRDHVKRTFGRMVLIATASLGFSAMNEVVEFIATLMGPSNVGGYINTGLDLCFNTAGAVTAAVALKLRVI